jgi:hypothetical protein
VVKWAIRFSLVSSSLAAIFNLSACDKTPVITTPVGQTQTPIVTEDPIVTPDPTDPIVTPDPNDPIVTPDPNDPIEEITEAEYKVMVEEKLEGLIKEVFDNKISSIMSHRTLENFEIKVINKEAGLIYGYSDVDNLGENKFIEAQTEDPNLFKNCQNYEQAWDVAENLGVEDIEDVNAYQNIASEVTPESYDAFLNSIVSDQLFKDTLVNAGLVAPDANGNYKTVVRLSNAYIYDNVTIKVLFVDLNGKRIESKVIADITLQESSSTVNHVVATTNCKNRWFTEIKIEDFSTFEDPTANLLNQEQGLDK